MKRTKGGTEAGCPLNLEMGVDSLEMTCLESRPHIFFPLEGPALVLPCHCLQNLLSRLSSFLSPLYLKWVKEIKRVLLVMEIGRVISRKQTICGGLLLLWAVSWECKWPIRWRHTVLYHRTSRPWFGPKAKSDPWTYREKIGSLFLCVTMVFLFHCFAG